jgi:tol-pal system protein YbgF
MVRTGKPLKKMSTAKRRSTALFVIALACLLWTEYARAQDTPSDLVTRIDRLEETVRDLTGSVQELQYRNQQLEQQVQQLRGGAAPVAGTVPAGPQRATVSTALPPPTATPYSQPGTQYSPPAAQYLPPAATAQYAPPPPYGTPPAPVVAAAPPLASGHDAFNPALNPSAPGAPHPLGTSTTETEPPPAAPDMGGPAQPGAPLNLSNPSGPQAGAAPDGALPPPPMSNPNATGAMQQASLPPNATPKDEYDLAYGYVVQKNYGPAAQTFRDFLHKYPSDRLTPEAQYWLGESLFEDQKYHDAAEAFLAVSTKYETSARAPDALMRLGESLAALGEKEAACASLGEVLRKYPHASISVKQGVDRDQKRVHC